MAHTNVTWMKDTRSRGTCASQETVGKMMLETVLDHRMQMGVELKEQL